MDPVLEFFSSWGGTTAALRWNSQVPPASKSAGGFFASATALLRETSMVAARCGDKTALTDFIDKYYGAYYEFARQIPDLSVVRIFGLVSEKPLGKKRKEEAATVRRHNDPTSHGVLALRAKNSGKEPDGFGIVLFRHAELYSALIHWSERKGDDGFRWRITSDPLLTLVLRDWFGTLVSEVPGPIGPIEREKGLPPGSVMAFCRRFGICVPSRSPGV